MTKFADLRHRLARPQSPACDVRLTDVFVESVELDDTTLTLRFSGGRGWMNVAGAGMQKTDEVVAFTITAAFDTQADAELFAAPLRRWLADRARLRVFAEPGYWTVLMAGAGDVVPLPRATA